MSLAFSRGIFTHLARDANSLLAAHYAIYQVAHRRVTLSGAGAAALVKRWFLYDSMRVVLIAAGFISAVRAISIPYAEEANANSE